MVMPLAVRVVAAVIGALLVITGARSVIGTIIVPRPVGSWLTRWVDRIVNGIYQLVTSRIADYKRRDRMLAGQAAAILLVQLVGWLVLFYVGFSLLLWPFEPDGIAEAFDTAGPAVFGPNPALGAAQKTIADLAALLRR